MNNLQYEKSILRVGDRTSNNRVFKVKKPLNRVGSGKEDSSLNPIHLSVSRKGSSLNGNESDNRLAKRFSETINVGG